MNRLAFLVLFAALIAAKLDGAERENRAQAPSVEAISGKPNLSTGSYDVGEFGYLVEEFFVSGNASSYKLAGEPTADGRWEALPATNAPYATRLVVIRPRDPAKFSGTAVVEWLNVTGGFDVPVEWTMVHREIARRGHAYVAVTAQKVGIEGKPNAQGAGSGALKKADPARYGRLSHPGDAHAFDIFSQAGALVKNAAGSRVLGPLVPARVIAAGESQSAYYLTTYATAIDPVAKVYDGFLIHSRFGQAAPIDGSLMALVTGTAPVLRLRPDLRVPVLTVNTESDVLGFSSLKGTWEARQPDAEKLRTWEITGSAHADNYVFSVGYIDSGSLPIEKLAAAFAPTSKSVGRKMDQPINFGPQHHYVVQAALWQLERWVRTGESAPKAPELNLTDDRPRKLLTDAHGIAEGGLRTPWVDVPTAVLSGAGSMVGFGKPFDAATLERLYPGGKDDYLKKFEASLDTAIARGFIVPEDKAEIIGLARFSFVNNEDFNRKEVVGSWKLSFNPGDNEREATLTIARDGAGLKAAYKDGDRKFGVTKVEFKDGKLVFSTETKRDGEKSTATFEGKIEDGVISGEASWEYQGMTGSFPFTGKREAVKP